MEVYLDNSATTRTFPEVAELMTKIMCEDYGNPSSLHMKGVEVPPLCQGDFGADTEGGGERAFIYFRGNRIR